MPLPEGAERYRLGGGLEPCGGSAEIPIQGSPSSPGAVATSLLRGRRIHLKAEDMHCAGQATSSFRQLTSSGGRPVSILAGQAAHAV